MRYLVTTIVSVVLVAGSAMGAPTQWLSADGGNDHWYDLGTSNGLISWNQAKQNAANSSHLGLPGHLVSIGSAAEQNFIVNHFSISYPGSWIGLTDEAVEGSFVWITGEPLTVTAWNAGEPNNNPNDIGPENYVHIFPTQGQYLWNDLPNLGGNFGAITTYVIEYEPVPEPSTLAMALGALVTLVVARRARSQRG